MKESSDNMAEEMRKDLLSILTEVVPIFMEYCNNPRKEIFEFALPNALEEKIDFSLGKMPGKESIVEIVKKTLKHSPNVYNSKNANYLYSAPDPIGLVGDWLISFVNTNVHAYEAAPVFATAEVALVNAMKEKIGYSKRADGIFCPGGSYSNMLALYCAKKKLNQKEITIIASSQAHYSLEKAVDLLGISRESIVRIPCDKSGGMSTSALHSTLKDKMHTNSSIVLWLTGGTTVLGGFDPIQKSIDMIRTYKNSWVHVDAAWGGSVIFSSKHIHFLRGIDVADSITYDFHKAMEAPILCSLLLMKDGKCLQNMFHVEDEYLLRGNEEYGVYELGRKTAQCGRRADAFKFWLMWKVYGEKYFTERVLQKYINREKVISLIKNRSCFYLYNDKPDFLNVCFWYLPPDMRANTRGNIFSEAEKERITQITKKTYNILKSNGNVLINYAHVDSHPDFFRYIANYIPLKKEGIHTILDEIEGVGDEVCRTK